MQALLLESMGHREDAVRMAALQWALKLFPFSHVPARYIALLAAGDARFQLCEAGLEGLSPDKYAPRGGGGGATGGATGGKGAPRYPPLAETLAFLLARHPRLGRGVEELRELPLPAKVRAPWGCLIG